MEKLPGDYIAGFTDGEGCFALKFRRDVRHDRKNKPVYFYWDIEFAIVLRADDLDLLKKIQLSLGCGKISVSKRDQARYSVNKITDLSNKIVPFIERHRLHGKKRFDFELWKEAVLIFRNNQRIGLNRKKGEKGFHKTNWNHRDLQRLIEIHKEMANYKSKSSKEWKWLLRAI